MSLWLWFAVAQTYTWWVQPCSRDLARRSMCEAADTELAEWALQAWESASQGRLRFERAAGEEKARIRIYWAAGSNSRYGEARPIEVDRQVGAAIYVRPDLSQLGPDIEAAGRRDRLFRHAVVYLTCLHESGHVMGLPHTAGFEDIMYNFAYGGDIVEYFQRYRRRLRSREDIRNVSGISAADQKRLLAIYDR